MTRRTHSTQETQALGDALNYFIHKDLVNIIRDFYEPPAGMKLLLSEFSDTYEYEDHHNRLMKHSSSFGLMQYNYGEMNKYVFETRVRFVGSRGQNIFNERGEIVGKVPFRYFASLAPCDLMI